MNKTQLNSLDIAKLLFSYLVITIHIAPCGVNPQTKLGGVNLLTSNYLALLAVPFFFVSTGFLLFQSDSGYIEIKRIKKHVLKLAKLYLIWSAIYFPITAIGIYKSDNSISYELITYIRNFVLFGSYSHLWYLPASIIAIIGATCLLRKHINSKRILSIGLLLYFLVVLIQYWNFGGNTQQDAIVITYLFRLIDIFVRYTRNYIFGFAFVCMGMYISDNNISMPRIIAMIAWIVSMLLLLVEIYFVSSTGLSVTVDRYIFLLPSVFFLFLIIKDIRLPDSIIYRKSRDLSTLIYFTHRWVQFIMAIILHYQANYLWFLSTAFVTTVVSGLIIVFSERNQFKFICCIYK